MIKHDFLKQSSRTGRILGYMLIYAAHSIMCAFILVVCYHYETFVNTDITGLNVIVSDPNCTKIVAYFSNRCIADLTQV